MSFAVARPYQIDYNIATPPPPTQQYPSFLENLGGSLGAGLGEGIQQGTQKKLKQGILDKALKNLGPESSIMDRYLALHQADPELAKNAGPLLRDEAEAKRAQAIAQQKEEFEFEKQRREILGRKELQVEKSKAKGKHAGANALSPEARADLQSSFDDIGKLWQTGSLGAQSQLTPWNTGYNEAAGELDALKLPLVDYARKLENQGHLTAKDMDRVFAAIPKSSDRLDTIRGKMRGLAKILKLNPGVFGKLEPGEKLESLPTAGAKKNDQVIDDETGELWIFNGKTWQNTKKKGK